MATTPTKKPAAKKAAAPKAAPRKRVSTKKAVALAGAAVAILGGHFASATLSSNALAGAMNVTNYQAPQVSSPDHQRPTNINPFSTDKELRRAMASAGVRMSTAQGVKHRGPGERAHRRWRLAKAAGKGGARG